jgi:5-methylcytosine-specific restriction endonuclease McrA
MSPPTPKRPWARWYGLQRWRNRARLQLQQHPLCAMCLEHGVVIPANVADHVVPHHGHEQLFWYGELQSLCFAHHNASKQQIETKGFARDVGVDGWPVDANHPVNRLKDRD